MGWNASDTRPLTFTECRVPEENLLGPRGSGFKQFLHILDIGRIGVAAMGVGLAQGALDQALKYATRVGASACSRTSTSRRAAFGRSGDSTSIHDDVYAVRGRLGEDCAAESEGRRPSCRPIGRRPLTIKRIPAAFVVPFHYPRPASRRKPPSAARTADAARRRDELGRGVAVRTMRDAATLATRALDGARSSRRLARGRHAARAHELDLRLLPRTPAMGRFDRHLRARRHDRDRDARRVRGLG